MQPLPSQAELDVPSADPLATEVPPSFRPPASWGPRKEADSRLARGSIWALLGYGGGQALRLLNNAILWRLLYQSAFGLMTIVNTFMTGLAMFSDVGIGPSIVQSDRGDDPEYLNTAWTIQAARGLALFGIAAIAAIPVSRLYHEPELASLIPVVACGSILAGFNSTKLFTVTRKLALGRLTALDLSSQAVGLVAMVGWGLVYRDIWALVVGGIVTNFSKLVLGHLFLPGVSNRFRWDRPSAHTLIHFGRWIFISTLLTFGAMQSDRLIFGTLVPMSVLGVYNIATTWASIAPQVLGHVFQSVLFPHLSNVYNENPAELPSAYRRSRLPWLFGAGWLSACLIAGAPTIIRFVYDERAVDAGWTIQVLTAGTWFLGLEMSNGSALLAQGRTKWVAAGSAAKLLGMAVLIPTGYLSLGFPGAVLGFAASEVFRYTVSLIGAHRAALKGYKQDVIFTAVVAATTALGWGAHLFAWRAGIGRLSENHVRAAAFLEGVFIFVVLTAAWGLMFWAYRRRKIQPTAQPA